MDLLSSLHPKKKPLEPFHSHPNYRGEQIHRQLQTILFQQHFLAHCLALHQTNPERLRSSEFLKSRNH